MEIKYEPVFGPQELFDGFMDDCEFASEEYGYKFANGALYYYERYNEKAGWALSCKTHLTFKPSAMRRIIRTPTWTVADQKAGKLPAVGCVVMVSPNCTATVTAVDNIQKVVSVQCENQALDILAIHEMLPIESPEGKAARLRDEWVERAVGLTPVYEIAAHGYSTQLRIDISSIYDAMISGDLPVLSKGV